MKATVIKCILFAAVAIVAPMRSHGINIGLDLGPTGVITTGPNPQNSSTMLSVPFSTLNGAPLDGSSILLNLIFLNNEFIRIFSDSPAIFSVGLVFYTNAGGFPGFMGDGTTASLLDSSYNPFGGGSVGRAMSSNGSFSGGLFPGTNPDGSSTGELDGRPYDFHGLRFELVLPSTPNILITSGEFRVSMSTDNLLGVGPGIPADIRSVPDTGNSLVYLTLALGALWVSWLMASRGAASGVRCSPGK